MAILELFLVIATVQQFNYIEINLIKRFFSNLVNALESTCKFLKQKGTQRPPAKSNNMPHQTRNYSENQQLLNKL